MPPCHYISAASYQATRFACHDADISILPTPRRLAFDHLPRPRSRPTYFTRRAYAAFTPFAYGKAPVRFHQAVLFQTPQAAVSSRPPPGRVSPQVAAWRLAMRAILCEMRSLSSAAIIFIIRYWRDDIIFLSLSSPLCPTFPPALPDYRYHFSFSAAAADTHNNAPQASSALRPLPAFASEFR